MATGERERLFQVVCGARSWEDAALFSKSVASNMFLNKFDIVAPISEDLSQTEETFSVVFSIFLFVCKLSVGCKYFLPVNKQSPSFASFAGISFRSQTRGGS